MISANGSVVAFFSNSNNLHTLDTNTNSDVYARNLATGTTYLVSVNKTGTGGGNGSSAYPVISADGSVVAFSSDAFNLHALDNNTISDVFARNLVTGTTYLVSVNKTGNGGGNSGSTEPVISADGSVVAFSSDASNIGLLADNNSGSDVFARNLLTGTTHLVSVNTAGNGSGNYSSSRPAISSDGSVVAFVSFASNLHPLDSNTIQDVYARNLATGTTQLVTTNAANTGSGNGNSFDPIISANGSVVAFVSESSNLHALDTTAAYDVYTRNLLTGTTYLVSENAAGSGSGNGISFEPTISADGSVVAFVSESSNLHPLDAGTAQDVYARNLVTGTTYLASVNASGDGSSNSTSIFNPAPAISADGSTVAFTSIASDLIAGDFNSLNDVFIYDISSGTTHLTSRRETDLPSQSAGYQSGFYPSAVSADGRYVAFHSSAPNLVSGMEIVPNVYNVYRLDRTTGTIALVSINAAGDGSGNADSDDPVISADGNVVAFRSRASNLDALDLNVRTDVYARNLATGTTYLVSVNATGDGSSNNYSGNPVISASGNVVVYTSNASDLHPLDSNTFVDVYARNLDTGTTYLVSVNAAGDGGGNANSSNTSRLPGISADGTVVAFESNATNLHALDMSTHTDVYARNLLTGTMHLVSVNVAGTGSSNSSSFDAVISADGSVVAFKSNATNLNALDTSANYDVFARNLLTGTTHLVSVNVAGTGSGNGASSNPVISANGNVVAFESSATNLHALDTSANSDVLARNLSTGTTYLVSINSAGDSRGNGGSQDPSINSNGNVVAFESSASNLHALDTNTYSDVFARNLLTETTYLVSINSSGNGSGDRESDNSMISADGSAVVFSSSASNLVAGDFNNAKDVFIAALLSPEPAELGDYNRNSRVDAADYMLWRKTLGASGLPAYSGADGSGNGTIGSEDYGVWRTHYGETYVAASGASGEKVVVSLNRSFVAAVSEQESYEKSLLALGAPIGSGFFVSDSLDSFGQASRGTHKGALAKPVAPQVSRDEALLAWVESADRVRESAPIEFEAISHDSREISSDESCDALDVAVGELMSAAL